MRVALGLLALSLATPCIRAQSPARAPKAAGAAEAAAAPRAAGTKSTCLVLPFENRSGNSNLNWIGASFVVSLRQALAADGVQVLDRTQQERALAMVGATAGANLSLATEMRMADTADAGWLVAGWFDYDGTTIAIHAGVVNVQREHWVPLAEEAGPLKEIERLEGRLDWAVRQRMLPDGAAAPEAAVALPLPAYESYIRAELTANNADKIRFLLAAQHLAPKDGRILFALGMAYFSLGHDDSALQWLSPLPLPEARFTAALAAYHLRKYGRAVGLLQPLADEIPLPAVVQDLALAQAAARQPQAAPGQLETEFPADAFRQLSTVVAAFSKNKEQTLPAGEQADRDLTQALAMQKQGALEAAVQIYQRVAGDGGASAHQQAEAHAGLAEIALVRHDRAQAEKEAGAALAAEADDVRAKAISAQLGESGRG